MPDTPPSHIPCLTRWWSSSLSASAAWRRPSAVYSIADEDVLGLCEQVCGGLRRQLDELDTILGGSTR